jgi:UPF0042 nucleotide-binding protein
VTVTPRDPSRVVVVTGLYGAGKSTALAALSEVDYFCIDNLPASVVEHAVQACEDGGERKIALGIHVGRGSAHTGVGEVIDRLGVRRRAGGDALEDEATQEGDPSREVTVLFLDATDHALVRRFNETRRPHPLLSRDRAGDPKGAPRATSAVLDGVRLERERLAPLRLRSTFELDTSNMSVHDLRRRIHELFAGGAEGALKMETRLVSFGFKYGLPVDANVVFDVRFLDNPYFVPELRPLTGLDEEVRAHIFRAPEAKQFVDMASELLAFCVPRYEREGKSYLTVAIGCTGGQHRSVALAEVLAGRLKGSVEGAHVTVVHRDAQVDKGSGASGGAPPGEGNS